MSSTYLSFVWSRSRARGSHKLVLLALAEHADRNGEAELSLRDMAMLCGLSKSRVEEIIQSLVDLGELRIRVAGAGRGNPTRYWITLRSEPSKRPDDDEADAGPDKSLAVAEPDPKPEPEKHLSTVQTPRPTPQPVEARTLPQTKPQPTKVNPATTQADVDAVLAAAGISAPDDQPFYWSRMEHRSDLNAILINRDWTVEQLCTNIRAAISKGKALQHRPRRLTELSALLGKGVAA